MTEEEKEEFKEKCPKCSTPWSYLPRIVCAGNWVHCIPCNKKAEQLMKEKREEDKRNIRPGTVDWRYNGWQG